MYSHPIWESRSPAGRFQNTRFDRKRITDSWKIGRLLQRRENASSFQRMPIYAKKSVHTLLNLTIFEKEIFVLRSGVAVYETASIFNAAGISIPGRFVKSISPLSIGILSFYFGRFTAHVGSPLCQICIADARLFAPRYIGHRK